MTETDEKKVRIIEVKESVFAANDEAADKLRARLKEEGTFLMNVMGSPGAGKTSTLLKTIGELKGEISVGVMEADIDSDVDARDMLAAGIPSIQIHTGGMCHLDAGMTETGVNELQAYAQEETGAPVDLAILENVGNLVCPAEFDTGANANVEILSVPEGDDKPYKYPLMFETTDVVLVNKIDVMEHFDFDKKYFEDGVYLRNPEATIIYLSAKTGEGIDAFASWINDQISVYDLA